ncbi:LysR family transcriptional regulator [Pluralibacter gergoviae]|uniref:LysR family transcriptional regulator n=1 Tax=Pluralibacter gergoviae TaxID=61647 RepID=A0AAW8HP09_PLUGE|nr:LysR family transcriptional regulator [Pluralibacter gergoviae]AVR02863.1 LysR family transcriptional regulator [Pluralibacter gergoviae]KMK05145.1 transcriptional regulator [Pluralibacter gergoviae]KMK29331.1 transcriptional regulator [Pluralibacter gergoviae]MDQ2309288.1 LysR family transcriptional regulator [Pluralibacter gergoviae]MDU4004189.1 LysR family transcriptional regulator [Pluralibacter gergoviae]
MNPYRASMHELEMFAAIAHHLSFRKAAQARNVTPSALSHAMRHFEERLGVRLLQRTTRKVALTEAGERFLARIQPALADLSQAVDELNDWRSDPRGTLRISMPRSAEALYFEALVLPFLQRYPEITLEIDSNDALVDIVAGGFDAGVRYGNVLAQDMVAVPFGAPMRSVAVASPALIARLGTPRTPDDLLRFPCIERRFPSGRRYRWEFWEAGCRREVAVAGTLVLDNNERILQAARADVGVAFLHDAAVRAQLESGELVEVLSEFTQVREGFWLYYPGRKHLTAPMRHFIDWVKARSTGG